MTASDGPPEDVHSEDVPYEAHVVVPGVFSAAQCRRIIELGTAIGTEPAGLETGGTPSEVEPALDGTIRSSSVAWIPRGARSEWIHAALEEAADRVNQRYRFDLSGIEEDLQFTVYDHPGAFYTWHQDGLDVGVTRRKLSLVVPLSAASDYRGGSLELFGLSDGSDGSAGGDGTQAHGTAAVSARRGSVVAFPSFEYHRVTPLRSGTRYSLVAWVGGPPFR